MQSCCTCAAAVVWAFGRLGFHPGPLLGCLAERVAPGVRGLCPDAVARTAWAFAALDHGDRSLIAAVVAAAAPRLHMYSAQVLVVPTSVTRLCNPVTSLGNLGASWIPAYFLTRSDMGCDPRLVSARRHSRAVRRPWWTWPGPARC